MAHQKYPESSFGAMEMPSGAKQNIRAFARKLYLDVAGARAKNLRQSGTVSLYCHFVFRDQIKAFERIIIELQRFGRFISSDELLYDLQNEKVINELKFHLSFDDGLKNNIRYALPVLEKYNIPATFFVPTNFIGASYEKAREYCEQKTKYPKVLELMDASDLKLLIKLGYTIGSHTHTHDRLSEIHTRQRLQNEIVFSKNILEDLLGVECRYFSWPYGNMDSINLGALNLVKDAGYKLCFGGFRGSITSEVDPFLIPRHHFEPHWPINHIKYFLSKNYEKTND